MGFIQKRKLEEKKVESGTGSPEEDLDPQAKRRPKLFIRKDTDGKHSMDLYWPKEATNDPYMEDLLAKLEARRAAEEAASK